MPPVEPPASRWSFPIPAPASGLHFRTERGGFEGGTDEVVGVGADLEPGTLLAAYRSGLFPMPVDRRRMGWWSPDPRGILPLDPSGLRVSRSLRKACARFEIRVDTTFGAVVRACGDPKRPGGWISKPIVDAYTRLHELGWAHSVEAWSKETGRLAGGLYGIAIGGLFAGESMFHHETDASKVALVALVEQLTAGPDGGRGRLLDVQWQTPHLATLGVVEIPRAEYLRRLPSALALPLPSPFS